VHLVLQQLLVLEWQMMYAVTVCFDTDAFGGCKSGFSGRSPWVGLWTQLEYLLPAFPTAQRFLRHQDIVVLCKQFWQRCERLRWENL
jgi:hypothetical protein